MFQRILHLTFMHRDLDQRFRIVDVSHNNIQYLYSLIWLDVPRWWSKSKNYVQNVGLYLVALSLCHVTHINHSACTNIFLITTMHRQLIPSIPSSCEYYCLRPPFPLSITFLIFLFYSAYPDVLLPYLKSNNMGSLSPALHRGKRFS